MHNAKIPTSIDLVWHGPYVLNGSQGEDIFAADVVSKPGIYVWTIPYEDAYLVYYVGETGTSFKKRLQEHLNVYRKGESHIYDPRRFATGERIVLWEALWGKNITPTRLQEFERRRPELMATLDQLLTLYRIFLLPLELESPRVNATEDAEIKIRHQKEAESTQRRVRNRIEAAITYGTRKYVPPAGPFQDLTVKHRARQPGEKPIRVRMICPVKVLGLDPELIA